MTCWYLFFHNKAKHIFTFLNELLKLHYVGLADSFIQSHIYIGRLQDTDYSAEAMSKVSTLLKGTSAIGFDPPVLRFILDLITRPRLPQMCSVC